MTTDPLEALYVAGGLGVLLLFLLFLLPVVVCVCSRMAALGWRKGVERYEREIARRKGEKDES